MPVKGGNQTKSAAQDHLSAVTLPAVVYES